MTDAPDPERIVTVSRLVAVGAPAIFELIADPERQPSWDGNGNLASADPGQRVHGVGDVFVMALTTGAIRDNHVVEFVEGRRIAWQPAEPGATPVGHLWRWTLDPVDADHTTVTHTYDWTKLSDPARLERARSTTADKLRASLDRLAGVAATLQG